jgi:membrane-bound ClpP family serine protease
MRRGLLFSTLLFLSCLNYLCSTSTMSLHSGFLNCFMLDLFCSNTPIILALFLQVIWIQEFMRPNSHTFQFSLFHSLFTASQTFSSIVKTFLLFIAIAMLSHYQSPVNSSSGKVHCNFTHKVSNQSYYCHFPGLELM